MLFFAACDRLKVEDAFCANEKRVFSLPDSLQKITLDYQLEAKPLMSYIEKQLGIDLCQKPANFGVILANNNAVTVQLHKIFCVDGIISCFIRRDEAQISLNKEGVLLVEQELVAIDSITYWLEANLLNRKKINYKKTSLSWETDTPKDSIEKTFVNIKKGYVLSYRKRTTEFFKKTICDVSSHQLDSLQKLLPLTIRLELNKFPIPPPPPIPEKTTNSP
ncbi:hypothetical protein KORDIASMS9_04118 [Kordia sp. SMS9]|nr:hypothetical protein KORDIASMS9_04118 [Kordia sp. SMS9]